jgi:hypothetical protein
MADEKKTEEGTSKYKSAKTTSLTKYLKKVDEIKKAAQDTAFKNIDVKNITRNKPNNTYGRRTSSISGLQGLAGLQGVGNAPGSRMARGNRRNTLG